MLFFSPCARSFGLDMVPLSTVILFFRLFSGLGWPSGPLFLSVVSSSFFAFLLACLSLSCACQVLCFVLLVLEGFGTVFFFSLAGRLLLVPSPQGYPSSCALLFSLWFLGSLFWLWCLPFLLFLFATCPCWGCLPPPFWLIGCISLALT